MADVYTYEIGNKLYINMTNKCNNDCEFCIRNHGDGIEGYKLWLKKEPTVEEIKTELKDAERYQEVVFCGFGEPLFRIDDLIEVAKFLKSKNIKTRINTNGQAELITKRKDTALRLKGLIDTINISLNGIDAKDYVKACRPREGEKAYYAMLDFTKECVKYIPEVIMSVVDVIGAEKIEKAKVIAESLGAKLRVREFI